jgi:hypothetical protein
MRDGAGGPHVQEIAVAVYKQWCEKSLTASPQTAAREVKQILDDDPHLSLSNLQRALSNLGLENAPVIAEAVYGLKGDDHLNEGRLASALWPAFESSIDQLCAQTAHVLLARTLLYRVGEDEHAFERKLSGTPLARLLTRKGSITSGRVHPATEATDAVRSDMAHFLPTVYLHSEKSGSPGTELISRSKKGRYWKLSTYTRLQSHHQ